jgi:hypothetical protein
MKLPYGNQADVKQITDKLQTYSLNLNHPNGKHKARLFRAKLGITIDNQDFLITKLRKVAAHYQNFELTDSDQYGERYVAVFPMTTTTGTAKVLSAWIIRPGETYPRLTSVYPIRN